jgi:hypothetical protein
MGLGHGLKEATAHLGHLTALTSLTITAYDLRAFDTDMYMSFPDNIGDMAELQTLKIAASSRNFAVPAGFGRLGKLTRLELFCNQVTFAAPALSTLTSLVRLNMTCWLGIHGNPGTVSTLSRLS